MSCKAFYWKYLALAYIELNWIELEVYKAHPREGMIFSRCYTVTFKPS